MKFTIACLVCTMVLVSGETVLDIKDDAKVYQTDPKNGITVPHPDSQIIFEAMYREGCFIIGKSKTGTKYIIEQDTGIIQLDRRHVYPNLLSGTWTNQLNSTLQLVADDNGQLTGQYQSGVGPVVGWYALSGQYDTNGIPKDETSSPITTLSFTVLWSNDKGDLQSITSWNGQLLSDGQHLYMGWILTTQSGTDEQVWGSLQFGVDQFTKDTDRKEQRLYRDLHSW